MEELDIVIASDTFLRCLLNSTIFLAGILFLGIRLFAGIFVGSYEGCPSKEHPLRNIVKQKLKPRWPSTDWENGVVVVTLGEPVVILALICAYPVLSR